MIVSIEISKVQHVDNMIFSVDLSENKITCIVGKNGIGKTTLVKAIKNLHSADTFSKTSSKHIFNNESFIKYTINDEVVTYKYDENLKVIDTKEIVPEVIKSSLFVELPIPHGMRFNSFPTLSKIDTELRKSIAFETFDVPSELISILNYVYETPCCSCGSGWIVCHPKVPNGPSRSPLSLSCMACLPPRFTAPSIAHSVPARLTGGIMAARG